MIDSDSKKQTVWQIIAAIPRGKVVTYGQLADMAGIPGQARWVGRLLSELPNGTGLPWHRVVNASGRITNPNYLKQTNRLLAEGIVSDNRRVNLNRFQWRPGQEDKDTLTPNE